MSEIQNAKIQELGLTQSKSKAGVVAYHRNLKSAGEALPILVLIHGYPQSAYEYEHPAVLAVAHEMLNQADGG